jgi:hypothetical protein
VKIRCSSSSYLSQVDHRDPLSEVGNQRVDGAGGSGDPRRTITRERGVLRVYEEPEYKQETKGNGDTDSLTHETPA